MITGRPSRIILETDRLYLRRLSQADLDNLVALWTDPAVTRYMGGPRDRQYLLQTLTGDLATADEVKYDLWPVYEKRTDEFAGHCGLLDKEVDGAVEIEINYVITPTKWGKGYATEIAAALKDYGFREYQLKRLIALINPDNIPSEKVAQKIGMRYTGDVEREHGPMKLYTIEKREST